MRKATSLACVVELGETGSSLKPARCDDTTGNHPNYFLLRFRAYALNPHTEQTGARLERGHNKPKGAEGPGRLRVSGCVSR